MADKLDNLSKTLTKVGLAGLAVLGIFLGVLCLSGCVDIPDDPVPEIRSSNVVCVVIGMETSQRFGACPGCKKDSDGITALLRSKYGYPVKLLQSEAATRQAVISTIISSADSVPADGLFILYYSGHGGQENLAGWSTSEPEGADGDDEYLCLYDDYLLDDEIWELLNRCKGRVFCGFDACHSATMFRSIGPEIAQRAGKAVPLASYLVKSSGRFNLKPRALPLGTESFRMLCWSGCQEREYSYGGTFGGVMTNAILENWDRDDTYKSLWTKVETAVQLEQPTQHPQQTQYGTGFDKVFR